jgi:hypothetical protein
MWIRQAEELCRRRRQLPRGRPRESVYKSIVSTVEKRVYACSYGYR